MSETGRKHVTVRYLEVPLQFDAEEQAFGTTLLALPDSATVAVHDANRIGTTVVANLTIITEEEMSQEELDKITEQVEAEQQAAEEGVTPVGEGGIIPSPATSIEQHRQNRARRKKTKSTPPPTSG